MEIHADIDVDHNKIVVRFQYHRDVVSSIKLIPGAKFVDRSKGGPLWRVPLTLDTARDLRDKFGDSLVISPDLKAWGQETVRRHNELGSLGSASDAELEHLPKYLPELAKFMHPYQRAAARFVCQSKAPLIADQPGLGKTIESIAGLFEGDFARAANLVVAPKTALRLVWQYELERWGCGEVFVMDESDNKSNRAVLSAFAKASKDEPDYLHWLLANPAKIRGDYGVLETLKKLGLGALIVDECHKESVRNTKTKTAKALYSLARVAEKCVALSGTPMTNKLVDLFGVLHFLDPVEYSSKWQWARRWLHVYHNGYGYVFCNGRTQAGYKCRHCDNGILKGMRDGFFESLSPHVLRRTKAEVRPELPGKRYVPKWCPMGARQDRQYRKFAKDSEIVIGDDRVSASIRIAEITRLKQFAISEQKVKRTEVNGEEKLILQPTANGGKLLVLQELLDERGIFDQPLATSIDDEKVVIFSQFAQVVKMLRKWLKDQGVPCLEISGRIKPQAKLKNVQSFQKDKGKRVMLCTTTAGGASITLDRADSIIFMDETWSASDMEQAEDRVHRVSRDHHVTVYIIRTKGSIDEQIMDVVEGKRDTSELVMDIRRLFQKDEE